MEIKLFGKELFRFTKSEEILFTASSSSAKELKHLPDFYKGGNDTNSLSDFVAVKVLSDEQQKLLNENRVPKENTQIVAPKDVYEMKLLHDASFELHTNTEYIDNQLADFKEKLGLIKSEDYDMRRGVEEISSVILRLENRKKYAEVKDFFEEYPYTTTSKISGVLKAHDYLKLGQVAQFLADMPKEAVEIMKNYNKYTDKICKKQAVFYIVADKKDFEKNNTRRDPILLAQSPFGHFWQILGAWDKEMLFIEEL